MIFWRGGAFRHRRDRRRIPKRASENSSRGTPLPDCTLFAFPRPRLTDHHGRTFDDYRILAAGGAHRTAAGRPRRGHRYVRYALELDACPALAPPPPLSVDSGLDFFFSLSFLFSNPSFGNLHRWLRTVLHLPDRVAPIRRAELAEAPPRRQRRP